MKITDYDKYEYDYSTYWKNRNYEHFAEVIALNSLLKNETGDWFLDVGGSYGRHLPSYSNKYKNCVILDYSLNTLINNRDRIKEKNPNTSLIAANAYFLPFRENVFDGGMMVRVLHHIQEPKRYMEEISRVLKPNAIYIQEFANKIHIKAIVKHILKLDFKFFNQKSYQQPSRGGQEGSNGEEAIFLNYHPKTILSLTQKENFELLEMINTSFFRLEIVKKLVPFKILIFLEKIWQKLFSFTNFSPSIFLKLKLLKNTKAEEFRTLEELLVCPKCKSELLFKKEECVCTSCKNRYEKVATIWDFRVQE